MNAVHLVGSVTREPHLRYTPNATALLHMHVAGRTHGRPWYHRVTIFGRQAEDVADTPVGAILAIGGRLEHRAWTTDDGQRRTALDIVADAVAAGPVSDDVDVDAKGQPLLQLAQNRVLVAGNLTRDPVARTISNGDHVTDGSIAINERTVNGERTHYVDITAWRAQADRLASGTKGGRVIAAGILLVDSWTDRSGNKRFQTKVDVRHLDVAGGRPAPSDRAAPSGPARDPADDPAARTTREGADEPPLPF